MHGASIPARVLQISLIAGAMWLAALDLSGAVTLKDASGRVVDGGATNRIVSIGGAVTEIQPCSEDITSVLFLARLLRLLRAAPPQ